MPIHVFLIVSIKQLIGQKSVIIINYPVKESPSLTELPVLGKYFRSRWA